MKKIKPPTGTVKNLMEDFRVTRTTVNQALAYYNNSATAIAIRKRAIKYMEEELQLAKEYEATINIE